MPARSRRSEARRVCVDTGGTFTDLIELRDGAVRVHKVLSTPRAPEQGVLRALAEVGGGARGGRLVHGSTVGLNSVLTGAGAKVALVTNAGFEDLIEIGRQDRPELYALHVGEKPVLVPRSRRFGIRERRLADGAHEAEASGAELKELQRKIRRSGADAIAICLLHSYAWPEDEDRIAAALRPLALPISTSSSLLRRHREYERFSTTLVNAFIRPVVSRYLERLAEGIAPMDLHVVRNEGGTMPHAEVLAFPARTILSGPAGGALGTRFWGRACGFTRACGFDMGGTSADVALALADEAVEDEARLGPHALALPCVPITSVGCGGGSLAYRDAGGALRVGPMSAGADPGPACYGKGREPTVTDAHLLLGRLPHAGLLGGDFPLYPERAADALGRLAKSLGLTVRDVARGILDIADLQMARPLRSFTLGRGLDPEDVCLVAFGGAGGLHAARLAELIGFRDVLVPPHPGILSAVGMLLARPVVEREEAWVTELGPKSSRELEQRARALLRSLRRRARRRPSHAAVFAAVRYRGMNAEFWVEADRRAAERFTTEFERRYGFRQDLPIEVLRIRARLTFEPDRTESVARALRHDERRRSRATHPRRLGPGGVSCLARHEVPTRGWRDGPLAILDYSGTTIVEKGWRSRRHASGCLHLKRTDAVP